MIKILYKNSRKMLDFSVMKMPRQILMKIPKSILMKTEKKTLKKRLRRMRISMKM